MKWIYTMNDKYSTDLATSYTVTQLSATNNSLRANTAIEKNQTILSPYVIKNSILTKCF